MALTRTYQSSSSLTIYEIASARPVIRLTKNYLHHQFQHHQSTKMSEIIKTDPSNFLSDIIGSSVVVKLLNGIQYAGNLQSIDGFMNVVLDEGKEVGVGGRVYGDVFIRGNNGMYI